MKRIVICCVLALLIFVGGIVSVIYISNTADDIIQNIESLQSNFSKGNISLAQQDASKMSSGWKGFRKIHILTVDNDHALEISMSCTKIESLLKDEDDDLITECEVMKELIRIYKSEQIPTFMNVL